MSTKEVCSEHLHSLSCNYQQRTSEWREWKHTSAQLTSLCQHARVLRKTTVTTHTNGTLSTNCHRMLQEHTVFFQSKIQCISGNFYLKKKNKLWKYFWQKFNGPPPKEKYGGLLLLAPHFPLWMRFIHIYGNYKRDKCSLQELNENCWQQLNNPTIHSSYILDLCHLPTICKALGDIKKNFSHTHKSWSSKKGSEIKE